MPRLIPSGPFSGILAALLLIGAGSAESQQQQPQQQSVESEVRKALAGAQRSNPSLNVQLDPRTGLPTKIRGLAPNANLGASRGVAPKPATDEEAKRAVESFFAQSELSAAFPTKNAQAKVEALKVRNDPDVQGQKIVNVEQRVRGIKVFGSTGRVIVSPTLGVTQLTATLSTVAVEKTEPTVPKDQAIATARALLKPLLEKHGKDRSLAPVRANADKLEASADVVVFDPALLRKRGAKPGPARLAWLVSIDTFRIFVDAETGEQLFLYRDQPTGSPRQVYDLDAKTLFPGQKLVDEAAGVKPDKLPPDADLAYMNTGRVAAFFFEQLGRKGIIDSDEGAKTALESYVRYGDMENAFWCKEKASACPKGSVMVYGPSFAVAIDVVGHEMTHGIIAAEADLIYSDEPGAVNESLADLFGTLIEYYANGGNGNWVIGEQLPGFSLTQPLRSMANPQMQDADGKSLFNKAKDFSFAGNRGQPDRYSDYLKPDDPLCSSTSDYFNGCVHFNSGILNRFFFLISEGGREGDSSWKGIGRAKTARVAYRALTTQLHENSGLIETAEAFGQACRDLIQASPPVTDSSDCEQVDFARTATGLFLATQ